MSPRGESESDLPLAVLMLSPQFRPLVGGYERAAERLSVALAEAGLRVVVISERRDCAWPPVECIDGYVVRRLPCLYRPRLHVITSLLSFAGFLLRHGRGFDVWHVHQYGLHAGLAVALSKVLRRPVVLKLTSSRQTGIRLALGEGTAGRILGFLHRRVTACVATSAETREEAVNFGIPSQRVRVVPNGVDGRQFRPASSEQRAVARRELKLGCDCLVLYVGRLSAEKSPLGLLDAWGAISPQARSGAWLGLVGDGPDREAVRDKVKALNLGDTVYLAGNRSDVATWYQAADIFVIASDNEGLSNSMIEALASGVPVVSTSVSGSSILRELPVSGLVVDVGSVEQLSRAMTLLLLDGAMRTQLGENARRRFESAFSLASVANEMIALYEALLDRNVGAVNPSCAG